MLAFVFPIEKRL